jgi:hypothetical protein
LRELRDGASTLVHLVYFLMRVLILQKPCGRIPWDVRHRLMLQSLLGDGGYARILDQERIAPYCARIEHCLKVATRTGDVVKTPLSAGDAARFGHHIGAWIALMSLPAKAPHETASSRSELCEQATWFALRGMGMTDLALKKYYHPAALTKFFDETEILS